MNNIRILVVDDDHEFNNVLANELGKSGLDVSSLTDGSNLMKHLSETPCDVILLDIKMPGKDGMQLLAEVQENFPEIKVIMLTGFGTVETAVEALKMGAFDYLMKPSDLARIEALIEKAYRMSVLENQNTMLKLSLAKPLANSRLIGKSQAMSELRTFISQVAPSESSVLLLGESGTGKGIVASAIHEESRRKDQPFVVVDCTSLQESLLASELFGHEKGAFTGAQKLKHGLFEVADGGTILLDEIGDIDLSIQVKLLRVIETGNLRRLGGTREHSVNVRIIASTNRDLRTEMENGRFREDLFYRLNVIVTTLPPLRDRLDDLPLLVGHFLETLLDINGNHKQVDSVTLEALSTYDWPGNVRELRNVLERMVILSNGNEIYPAALPPEILNSQSSSQSGGPVKMETLEEIERSHIENVLEMTDGNRGQAAEILGIDPKTLYRKLKK